MDTKITRRFRSEMRQGYVGVAYHILMRNPEIIKVIPRSELERYCSKFKKRLSPEELKNLSHLTKGEIFGDYL